ncbi:hypothetical protein J7L05_03795 [bacterium]|nr:hypothetical protein [bacterium]
MAVKGIVNILFISLALVVMSGCAPQGGISSSTRILIGGNIQGQIYPSQEKRGFVQGTLARLGGMIDHMNKEKPKPVALIQAGNSISIENEKQAKTAELLAKGAQIIGFGANLASTYEFNDTPEYAKKRAKTGWKQVVSNVKPLDGVEPPIAFKEYHRADPGNGRFVYFLNIIAKNYYNDSSLLNEHYEWIEPTEVLIQFVRTIRSNDILVVYYQTDAPNTLNTLYSIQESEIITLLVLNDKVFQRVDKRRPDKLEGVNIASVPKNVSTLNSVDIWWDPLREEWKIETQSFMAGLNYKENKEIKKLLEKKK